MIAENHRERGTLMLDFCVETFLAVCRHMNFTKAARELSITQPAVSHLSLIHILISSRCARSVGSLR